MVLPPQQEQINHSTYWTLLMKVYSKTPEFVSGISATTIIQVNCKGMTYKCLNLRTLLNISNWILISLFPHLDFEYILVIVYSCVAFPCQRATSQIVAKKLLDFVLHAISLVTRAPVWFRLSSKSVAKPYDYSETS